ncbi:MAG TPA: response regulator [Mucilaginibacter sp.]|jgi:signal transduction histidine kinase
MNLHLTENINLLIVDDRADNVSALESSLERDGLNVFTTTSPKNVLEICIDKDISIALIDVKMPEMDGFELLDLIKNNPLTEHIMIILMTAYSMGSADVVKGLSKGAVDYLFKPLDLYIVNAKVNSLITLVNYQREIVKKNKELESYQKDLFKAMEETQKNKVIKENFLANMSHEIRTPLNAIIGLTSLLADTPLDEEQQEMVKLMEISSHSLLGIVNDILESAKIDAGKTEIIRAETEIISTVQNICDLTAPMARKKGLDLICDIDKNIPPMIMADSLRLNQILMNLTTNAIKFTNSGNVTVSLKMLEKREESVLLEFKVRDSGIGIPKSSLDRIFTRFEQVEDKTWQKFGGTGLGLSIVKKLVELKGGTLKVDSEIGVGTTFTFTNWYQLAGEIKKPDHKGHLYDLPKFENKSVLLAEDNAASRFVIVKMLKKWNINVDVAANGWEAVEKLKNNNYNLILMDTHMPVMNGNEATRKIRSEMNDSRKDIPILSFSASVIEKEKEEAKNAGADDFIEKPFEPKTLYNKIRKLIDSKGLRPLAVEV